ncbi:MAG: sulfate permease [Candidatus Sumerlaeia bacterium]
MLGILTFLISIFWALNMGASGFAVTFAPSYGARLLSRRQALLLFTGAVVAGALLIGARVVKTLSKGIVPLERIQAEHPLAAGAMVLVILGASALALFIANRVHIPQSTSIMIVGAIVGAGMFVNEVNWSLIARLLAVWVAFSVLAYFTTWGIGKLIYPPRPGNFKLYEKFFRHEKKLKALTVATDVYAAFGIGTNNVANVVGPLVGAGLFEKPWLGLLVFSPLFGLGALMLGRGVIETTSKEVIPLGTVSASLISLVTASFLIAASWLRLPAPYVQLSAMAVLAVHTFKEEVTPAMTMRHPITKKFLKVWLFTPLLGMGVTVGCLHCIRLLWPELLFPY